MADRDVEVTMELIGAWETWIVKVPDDVPENEIDAYVRDNIGNLDRYLDDAGANQYSITNIETKD